MDGVSNRPHVLRRVWWLRHGDKAWPNKDGATGKSPKGHPNFDQPLAFSAKKQLSQIASVFQTRESESAVVFSSPFRRCRQTAIALKLDTPILDGRIGEYLGNVSIMRKDWKVAFGTETLEDLTYKTIGGPTYDETWGGLVDRVCDFLHYISTSDDDNISKKNVIVITHGSVIGIAHRLIFGSCKNFETAQGFVFNELSDGSTYSQLL